MTRTIAGYVDDLGYLRCVTCAERSDSAHHPKASPVYTNAYPHAAEPCDVCHQPLSTPAENTYEYAHWYAG